MKKTIFLIIMLVIGNLTLYCQEVPIGTQIWSKNNLDVTTYSDGTLIPQVTDSSQWATLTTGAWCYFNNDSANGSTYGKLYNWYAVVGIYDEASSKNPNLRKKLAPIGWHVPTNNEWTNLSTFLGGNYLAGRKMKSIGTSLWKFPNSPATNESGFSGFPGGSRNDSGTFESIGVLGYWWSTLESISTFAWYWELIHDKSLLVNSDLNKKFGFSVRCIKD
jgi:uncharacterized protein (TIGR02145 family)